jgi:hypothetical protein
MQKQEGRLRHFTIPSHRDGSDRPFCPEWSEFICFWHDCFKVYFNASEFLCVKLMVRPTRLQCSQQEFWQNWNTSTKNWPSPNDFTDRCIYLITPCPVRTCT